MKVVFIGPSGAGLAPLPPEDGIEFRPPARMGDVARAVLHGAGVVGIVDGTFGDHAAVWHKEILFALSQGVHVLGAASMGALRAAECAAFGMVGVGRIFESLMGGDMVDDAAVALVHAPAALRHAPLSEALVNVEATCEFLSDRRLVSPAEGRRLREAARSVFFAERTHAAVAAAAIADPSRRREVARLLDRHRRDIKAEDARLLVDLVRDAPHARGPPPETWTFAETLAWTSLMESVRARVPASPRPEGPCRDSAGSRSPSRTAGIPAPRRP